MMCTRMGCFVDTSAFAIILNSRMRVRANYVVFQTLVDDLTRIQNAGKYIDLIVRTPEGLRFREKICVFDSVLVPNSLIYPV